MSSLIWKRQCILSLNFLRCTSFEAQANTQLEEEEEELVFIPRFSPPYGSLKVAYNRLPILSPQQTPCEVSGAESTPGKSSD